jgi:ParB family chromosome partitioning protein
MAKRRKLVAPSVDDLNRIEEEFRRETSSRGMVAPIAQVAAEAAAGSDAIGAEARAEQARYKSDSERLQRAESEGLLMAEIPLDLIDADAMVRDRAILDEAEMLELRLSISSNGLRLPIEVYQTENGRYGVLSGYRRLIAYRGLQELTGQGKYDQIRAIIRPATESDSAFVAMVEENEIRSNLSHFERGRIAVIATQQGAFVNVEEAVNKLYATASKAKRSKVRSFALIFEELGDLLEHAEQLTEKQGLRIASVLRAGGESKLRDALVQDCADAKEEWALMLPILDAHESSAKDPSRGGRPSKPKMMQTGWIDAKTIRTTSGITIRRGQDSKGITLRFEGRAMDSDLMDSLMAEIQNLLETP